MNSLLIQVKDNVTDEELEKLTFIYKQLPKTERGMLMTGSAMLLASQETKKEEEIRELQEV